MILTKNKKSENIKSASFIPFQQFVASMGFSNLGFYQAIEYYNRISVISTCVDLIAESMAQIHPILKERASGDVITEDPVTDLLARPSRDTSLTNFIIQLATFYLITGNTFMIAKGNTKYAPTSLEVVSPIKVSPMLDGFQIQDEDMRLLRYTDDGGRYYSDAGLSELLHIKRIQPYGIDKTRKFGQSKLASTYYEIDLWEAGRIYNRALLHNGVRPSGILLTSDMMADEVYDKMRTALASFSGPENSGKVMMLQNLGNEFKFEQMSLNSKDMEFIELSKDSKNSICNRLNVPLPLVNPDASTYNNVENAVYFLYDNAVFPLADILFDELSRFLLPKFDLDIKDFVLTYDKDEISAVKTRLINQIITKANSGLFTTNELRTEAGYPEIEGGNFLTHQSGGSPVTDTEYMKFHRVLNNAGIK